MRSRIAARTQPTYQAWQAVLTYVNAHQNDAVKAPSFYDVAPSYTNPSGHAAAIASIDHDGPLAYKLALAYRITGNETYAANAARFLSGWTRTTFSGSSPTKLVIETRFPAFIEAANLIRNSPRFTATAQSTFKTFIRTKILLTNTMNTTTNNWADWGMLLVVSTAAYLQDQALFNSAVAKYKYFISNQITAANEMKYETHRCGGSMTGGCSGVAYSNFAIMPLAEAAEIMKVNGVNLYGYVSPEGHTLSKAFFKTAYWTRNPCAFPYYHCPTIGLSEVWYMEILNGVYPNADASFLLSKYRLLDSKQSYPALTLTHANLTTTLHRKLKLP